MPRLMMRTSWLITLGAMAAIAAVVASQRRRTRVALSDAKRKLFKRLVEVAPAFFLAAVEPSPPAPAIEGGPGAVDGLEDFLRAAKCEAWLVRAATWCIENGAETLDELLQCQPCTRVGGILKLRFASTPMAVYRGVKEQFIRLPESFVAPPRGAFGSGVEPAPMSTTEAKEVAQSYAGDDVGSLFQIEFDAANLGAQLGFLSQYPKEEELVFPPGTMLTCMAVEPLEGQASKRLLRINCSINPDRQVKDAIAPLITHHHTPGLQGGLLRMYMLVVFQAPPVLFSHFRSHLSLLQQLASTEHALADHCAQWPAKGKAPICLRDADPSAVRLSLVRSQTHCLSAGATKWCLPRVQAC